MARGYKSDLGLAFLANPYEDWKITEDKVQMHIAKGLDALAGGPDAPRFFWCHVPNGELRNIRTARKLKLMGVKAGVWDILIWGPDGHSYFIEVKRPTITGRRTKSIETHLSDNQVTFRETLIALGMPRENFAVADDWEGVSAALKAWGLIHHVS